MHTTLDPALLALLLESLDDAVVVADAAGRVILFNAGASRMFGYAEDEVLGQPLELLMPSAARGGHRGHYDGFVHGNEASRSMAHRAAVQARRADGTEFPVSATIVQAMSASGRIGAAILRDISEQQRVEAELRRLSTTDPLTGLADRRLLLDRLQQEVAGAHRHARPLSLLVLDIDHFKTVNDRYGHAQGDAVLQRLAAGLQAELREGDSVGRLGGEEFAVVLPDTDLTGARDVAERIRQRTASERGGGGPGITVSVGAAELEADEEGSRLFQRADRALYDAKARGRNRVCVDPGQVPRPA